MQPRIARCMLQVFDPIVLVGYGAPELEIVCERLGLRAHRMSYYAMRAAALGTVSAEVVSALFYHHMLSWVSPAIPLAWSIATPTELVAARLEAVDGAFRRLFPQQIESAKITEAVALVREALEGCSIAGRALFAAHAALPWPIAPHLALWHGLNLLREHRGAGHNSALIAAQISPCQATVILIASAGEDHAGRRARWQDNEWHQAVLSLQERGWLDEAAQPTAAVLGVRTQIEDDTDALALEPWQHLGEKKTERLWGLLRDLAQAIIDQNGTQVRTPLGLSWPAQWPA